MTLQVYYDDDNSDYKTAMASLNPGLRPSVARPSSAIDFKLDLIRMILSDSASIGPALRDVDFPTDFAKAEWRRIVLQSHPYIWTHAMTETGLNASSALEIPVPVEKTLLPLNPMMWIYEKPPLTNAGSDEPFMELAPKKLLLAETLFWIENAALVPSSGNLASGTDGVTGLYTLQWHYYHDYDDGPVIGVTHAFYDGGEVPPDQYAHSLVGRCLFLQSPYIIIHKEAPVSSTQKRADRTAPSMETTINVITLRQRRTVYADQDESNGPVDWSCRWWNSGHWRNQACGEGLRDRRPTWIGDYIKGPEDKPLKDAVRLVTR